jgi:hypothetical protein
MTSMCARDVVGDPRQIVPNIFRGLGLGWTVHAMSRLRLMTPLAALATRAMPAQRASLVSPLSPLNSTRTCQRSWRHTTHEHRR